MITMNTSPAPVGLAALALVLASAGTVVAQPLGQPGRGRITAEQWQQVFPEHRRLALQQHQARIAIMQRGERCISGASDAEALSTCAQEERTAMRDQRRQHMEQMRQLFLGKGIEVPDWGRGGGGRGRGPRG
jgi:hypothetical protein